MTSQTDLLYVYTALSQTTFVSRRPCRRSFIADANSMASTPRAPVAVARCSTNQNRSATCRSIETGRSIAARTHWSMMSDRWCDARLKIRCLAVANTVRRLRLQRLRYVVSRCVSVSCIMRAFFQPVRNNYNLTSHKYVCITTYQPDTKSNPNPNSNPNPTAKQHTVVNIQLNVQYGPKNWHTLFCTPELRQILTDFQTFHC